MFSGKIACINSAGESEEAGVGDDPHVQVLARDDAQEYK